MNKEEPYSLVISDLHLSEDTKDITESFFQFLQLHKAKADKVFIIGDFFEFWLGDDDTSTFVNKIKHSLLEFSKAGSELFFIHGNRDFLIGKRFADACNMQILPDPYTINLYGYKILLSHGDLLCTNDKRYQRYRKLISQKWLQSIFLILPLKCKLHIANRIRQDSNRQKQKQLQKPYIADVSEDEVKSWFNKYQVEYIIHGHTHRFAEHKYKNRKRLVLGDWGRNSSYVCMERDKISLHYFNI